MVRNETLKVHFDVVQSAKCIGSKVRETQGWRRALSSASRSRMWVSKFDLLDDELLQMPEEGASRVLSTGGRQIIVQMLTPGPPLSFTPLAA